MKKPFNWKDYSEELKRDPGFDLFTKFSFDHLSQAECAEIAWRMQHAGDSLVAEADALVAKADALKAEHKARQRSHLAVIDGGAA